MSKSNKKPQVPNVMAGAIEFQRKPDYKKIIQESEKQQKQQKPQKKK